MSRRRTFPSFFRRTSLGLAAALFSIGIPAFARPPLDTFVPAEFSAIDGSGHNLDHPTWGAADIKLRRVALPAYEDGVGDPSGADRPNPRLISNVVVAQPPISLPAAGPTNFVWLWGQFVDHDLDLTNTDCGQLFNVAVPSGDPLFDPAATGTQEIVLCRSIASQGTGTGAGNPRQQDNVLTAWIDASNVYGSDAVRAAALRMSDGTGRLKMQAGPGGRVMMPYNTFGLPNGSNPGQDPTSMYFAGDVRANENLALASLHTLWVREHNWWANQIRHTRAGAALSDEQIYQRARSIVIGEIQAITYNEFLPALLGKNALRRYTGYHPNLSPDISTTFSTAAYRFGHTMLTGQLFRLDRNLRPIERGNIDLRDAFFNPAELVAGGGIEPLLRGAARQRANAIDPFIVDDVRNFLFGQPGQGGFDLASLNIQRGRDHGLPSYNEVRVAFGLPAKPDIASIRPGSALVTDRLTEAYGSVDKIDPWVGGLAETPVGQGLVGELVRRVLIDQFTRLRDGDRFFYLTFMPPAWANQIGHTRLSDVIRRNTPIRREISDDVFAVR